MPELNDNSISIELRSISKNLGSFGNYFFAGFFFGLGRVIASFFVWAVLIFIAILISYFFFESELINTVLKRAKLGL